MMFSFHNDSGLRLVDMYLQQGIKPNRPPVPTIPPRITGPCVYGHIITDEHRDHFRRVYPDIEEWQSCDPEALVSAASIINPLGAHSGITAEVYDRGEWRTCLIYADYKLHYPHRIADVRRSNDSMAALEKSLGITREPQWYPCYAN